MNINLNILNNWNALATILYNISYLFYNIDINDCWIGGTMQDLVFTLINTTGDDTGMTCTKHNSNLKENKN